MLRHSGAGANMRALPQRTPSRSQTVAVGWSRLKKIAVRGIADQGVIVERRHDLQSTQRRRQ
eukprot:3870838-Pleurochrysis_carterae.AAC.1